MAVEPSSEKKTLLRRGESPLRVGFLCDVDFGFAARTSFSASKLAGSLAKPRAEECAIFPSWRLMAALISGWR
jgi:hypothetical protein